MGSPIKDVLSLCALGWACIIAVMIPVTLITVLACLTTLTPEEQMLVHYLDGRYVYNGPLVKVFVPFRDREKRKALRVSELEFARVRNILNGSVRMLEGRAFEFLGPYEETDGIRPKIVLKEDEYVRLTNILNGEERIIRGPRAVVPDPWEDWDSNATRETRVQTAVFIDRDVAPIVINRADGTKRLHTVSGPFFPEPYEYIDELRELIRVLPHETMIVVNSAGRFVTKSGKGEDGKASGISFFLGPFDRLVELELSTFSAGADGNLVRGKELVSRFDMRARKMFFQFGLRTSDNVALQVQGSIFWRLIDVAKMVQKTRDPVADVYNKARNTLIAAVSSNDLETFMSNFKKIIQDAFNAQAGEAFYSDRGIEVNSMEVTKYDCTDPETALTLNMLIEEATDRINRIQAQHSENDVKSARLAADIAMETARTELIMTQATNERLTADLEGQAEGIELAKSLATFLDGLNTTVDSVADRVEFYRLQQTIKSQNLRTQAIGDAETHLYMRAEDLNVRLPGKARMNEL